MKIDLILDDCIKAMAAMPDGSVDAIVCDPPYGIGFLGKDWDEAVPSVEWGKQCLRVLKDGGHLIAFASTRTVHRLTTTVEDAGFDIRDQIGWVYFSGFPKSMDISKAIDKQRDDSSDILKVTAWIKQQRDSSGVTNKQIDDSFGFVGMAGHWTSTKSQPSIPTMAQIPKLFELLKVTRHEVPSAIYDLIVSLNNRKNENGEAWKQREVIGKHKQIAPAQHAWGAAVKPKNIKGASVTADGIKWQGWGTALKPAIEPAVLARKPIKGTVANNVLKHGTGAINIDRCRRTLFGGAGDWPANLIEVPKPSRAERERGCAGLAAMTGAEATNSTVKNHHPTVKPVELMRWLTALVVPKGGTVLDPFMGSGTAGIAAILCGVNYIGIERDPDYFAIAEARVGHAKQYTGEWLNGASGERSEAERNGQCSMFTMEQDDE